MPMYQSRLTSTHHQEAFTVRPDLWPPGSSVDLAWLDKGPQVWLAAWGGEVWARYSYQESLAYEAPGAVEAAILAGHRPVEYGARSPESGWRLAP